MKRIMLLLFAGVALSLPISSIGVVYAQNPLDPACESLADPSQSASCTPDDKKNPLIGANGLLAKITNLVAFAAGVAAVIMIMIAGFRYITANGDTQAATNARRTILGAVIGLVVVAAAWSIISFVLRSFS